MDLGVGKDHAPCGERSGLRGPGRDPRPRPPRRTSQCLGGRSVALSGLPWLAALGRDAGTACRPAALLGDRGRPTCEVLHQPAELAPGHLAEVLRPDVPLAVLDGIATVHAVVTRHVETSTRLRYHFNPPP